MRHYWDYGEAPRAVAAHQIETRLSREDQQDVTRLALGDPVRIHGLSTVAGRALNGQVGTVVTLDNGSGRYGTGCSEQRVAAVLEACLRGMRHERHHWPSY